jgi:IS30 family transposase
VEIRARIGDWEVDTVVGHKEKAALITLTDRKSHLCRAVKVHDRTADTACKAIQKTLLPRRGKVHTLTYDNGAEFSRHQAINRALGPKKPLCTSLPFMGTRHEAEHERASEAGTPQRSLNGKALPDSYPNQCRNASTTAQKMPWIQNSKSGIQR